MSYTLILVLIWVFTASATALTPYPWHRRLGLALLIGAVAILVAVAVEFGLVYAGLFFIAVASIYRRPLMYFLGKLTNRADKSEE